MSRQEEKPSPWLPSLQSAQPLQLRTCPDAEHARHEEGDISERDSEQQLVCEQVQPPAFCSATFGTEVEAWSISAAEVSD